MPGAPLTYLSHGGPYPRPNTSETCCQITNLEKLPKYGEIYLGNAKVDLCLNTTFLRSEEAHYKNFRVYPVREDKRAKKGATGEWEIW